MGLVRMHFEDQYHFVTNRCEQEQYLLKPTPEVKELIIEWLARALTFVDGGIELYAFVFLSNHFHVLLKDTGGKLALFMGYFQGNLARAVNRHLERRGKFWSREYDDVILGTGADFENRYRYVLANPVKAGLVASVAEWSGVSSIELARSGQVRTVEVVNRTKKHELTRHGRRVVDPSQYTETHELKLTPPPMWISLPQEEQAAKVDEHVALAEKYFREQRENRPCLGMDLVLAQSFTDRPSEPSRRPRIKVFSLDKAKADEMLDCYKRHVGGYREVYCGFVNAAQAGKRPTVEWPRGSYPPSCAVPIG